MSCFDFKNNKKNFGNTEKQKINMGNDATAPYVDEYKTFKTQINYMMDGMTCFSPDEDDEYDDDDTLRYDPMTQDKVDLMIDFLHYKNDLKDIKKSEKKQNLEKIKKETNNKK